MELRSGSPDEPHMATTFVVLERHLVEPQNTSWRIMDLMPDQKPWRQLLKIQEEEEGERRRRKVAGGKVPTTALPSHSQKALTTA